MTLGHIIGYNKDPKADYFKKLITNDQIKETANKNADLVPVDEVNTFSGPVEDAPFSEKPYFIFDKIAIISNKNSDFIDFLKVIKGIKINDLKQMTTALRAKKYNKVSESLEQTRAAIFGNKNELENELELYSIKEVINILPYYQKLASEPKLFLEKINGLIDTENTNIVEFNGLIDKTKSLKTKLMQTSFFDSNIIEQVCMIIALCLFGLFFVVRYAAYSIKSFISYLK